MDNAEMPEEIDAERENVLEWLDWLQSEDHGWLTGRHGKAIEIIRRVFRTKTQDAERAEALDYDEIMEEAEKLFRKHRYSGGARGQMIRPADSLDYWVMRATESKLRALTTPPDIKAVREAQRRLDQIQSSYLIAKSTLERKSLAETESCDELFAPIRNILNRMDGGENG